MKTVQLVSMTPEDLKELILPDIRKIIDQIKTDFTPKEPEQYLTTQDVMNLLHINRGTVNNWRKKGILTAYGIEGKILFKRSEVQEAVQCLD
ncbi:hypothetical protein BTO09_03605 [Gilvibacter sp. SZ-19]|uniref:helix-turn-helix domain-containing protein n=1 Tax=Gilvibacter sp. SZ-19 TaxID=754429 RepID=UPI000B3D0683|nr:helix-turn-helix domain-containing protein [Gilvibacter sp. SZ-19]ARV11479.1 hypothetical protein BTO09_03605 [Gilvibacter sp. SZ-19]